MIKVILYVIYALLGVFTAVVPIVYIKRKYGGSLKRAKDGIAVFLLFTSILNAVSYAVLTVGVNLSDKIEGTALSSAVIGSLLVTFCATFGRVIWIKFIIKEGETGDALLFGAGYASAYTLLSYVFTTVANVVISIILYANSNAEISTVFTSNVQQVQSTDLYTLFVWIVEMLLLYIFEMAISVAFFRVIIKGYDKKWLLAGIGIHFIGNALIRYSKLNDALLVLILLCVTVVAAGLAYSLTFNEREIN